MYNPSRGGVRGGADQFTWESVKNDKHRENYLGHSLKAPVGRWQKGKDLSWYAKERNETSTSAKSELASIKRAEEEAMLIALGHNIVRKTQALSKEDIREALKRNAGDRDDHSTERIDGVGASSQRVALLSGVSKDTRQTNEGVVFECRRERNSETPQENEKRDSMIDDRKKNKKKSKKHKKEKKHKKHHKESYHSDSSDSNSKLRMRHQKNGSDSDNRLSSNQKTHKISKHKHRDYSPDRSDEKSYSDSRKKNHKRHKKQSDSEKRRRHDSSESD